ncbi:MAG TPA: hypothetical protein VN257_07975 [Actinotalea sp.]|nr:hypothetical protein [Actinotalea sp.]
MTTSTPNTPQDDTLATEVLGDATIPAEATSPADAAIPADAPAAPLTPAAPPTPAPETLYLRGPAPFAITLGLLGLVIAGATFVTEVTDISLPWTELGPWTVVAAGLVVLLVGAIGLRGSRTRD